MGCIRTVYNHVYNSCRNGQTALNLAARHGHADIVSLLLEAGAEPDHADADGWTPLRCVLNSIHERAEALTL
jgi:ankyrin repeat protein